MTGIFKRLKNWKIKRLDYSALVFCKWDEFSPGAKCPTFTQNARAARGQ